MLEEVLRNEPNVKQSIPQKPVALSGVSIVCRSSGKRVTSRSVLAQVYCTQQEVRLGGPAPATCESSFGCVRMKSMFGKNAAPEDPKSLGPSGTWRHGLGNPIGPRMTSD